MNIRRRTAAAVSGLGLAAGALLVACAAVPAGPGTVAAAPHHAVAGHVVADDNDFGPGGGLGPSGVGGSGL